VCQTCAKLKNVCQVCVLDLQYGKSRPFSTESLQWFDKIIPTERCGLGRMSLGLIGAALAYARLLLRLPWFSAVGGVGGGA
jgi:hypothetical protein